MGLTRVFGVLGTNVLVASVQDILVHQRRSRRNLSEERHLDRLADLDSLALLHEDLARVLASVLAVQAGNAVLLRVVALLERLQGGHEVVATSDARRDDSFGDTGRDRAFDDGSDRVHRTDDFRLKLWGHVQLDLAEKVFRSAETTDNKNVLDHD